MSLRDFSGFGEFNLKLKELNFISLGMLQLLLRLAENKLFLLFQHGATQCCAEHCVSRVVRNTVFSIPFPVCLGKA